MRFGLLGSLSVLDDAGRPLELGGNQSPTVLAVLLAAGGRVVTAEALVDVLWGEHPPASAPGTLQSDVSRLRRELERGGGARILLWDFRELRPPATGTHRGAVLRRRRFPGARRPRRCGRSRRGLRPG